MERTLALIKPDAVSRGKVRDIFHLIEKNGFTILLQKKTQLREQEAKIFYKEHEGKSFYNKLVTFMTSGPVWTIVLAKRNAISQWRELMGPTNSTVARETAPESVRGKYGTDGTYNAVHGSDSISSATREIQFFFPKYKTNPLCLAQEEVGSYVKSTMDSIGAQLNPVLLKGLTLLAKAKPTNDGLEAAKYFGQWLIENNPSRPKKVSPGGVHRESFKESNLTGCCTNSEANIQDESQEQTLNPTNKEEAPLPRSVEDIQTEASTAVQAAYRGYITRKKLNN